MQAGDPIFENHIAFMETHRGRVARRANGWVQFVGDADFLTFGSPQSPDAEEPTSLEPAVWLYPWAGEQWPTRLAARGYASAEQLSYMELTAFEPRTGGGEGEIRVVRSNAEALDFAAVQDKGFIGPDSPNANWWREQFRKAAVASHARPGQRFYTFYSDEHPVGVLLSVTTGSTTGIYAVATDPAFRNRGISSALLARCCSEATGQRIVLQVLAGSYAEGFYSRLGFVESYRMQVWRRA